MLWSFLRINKEIEKYEAQNKFYNNINVVSS